MFSIKTNKINIYFKSFYYNYSICDTYRDHIRQDRTENTVSEVGPHTRKYLVDLCSD